MALRTTRRWTISNLDDGFLFHNGVETGKSHSRKQSSTRNLSWGAQLLWLVSAGCHECLIWWCHLSAAICSFPWKHRKGCGSGRKLTLLTASVKLPPVDFCWTFVSLPWFDGNLCMLTQLGCSGHPCSMLWAPGLMLSVSRLLSASLHPFYNFSWLYA